MSTTATLEYGIPRLDEKGYRDLTAYKALKLVQQAEFGHRPLTYICSPYSGDVEANVKIAQDLSAYAVQCRKIPLAPHLLFPSLWMIPIRGIASLQCSWAACCSPSARRCGYIPRAFHWA